MTDYEKLKEWKTSVDLYRRNAEGLGFKSRVRVNEGKIKISNNADKQYKDAINQLALYISNIQWVLDVLIDPYCFSLNGFEDELINCYPSLIEILLNEGYDAFVSKVFQVENFLCLKHSLPNIIMENGIWTLTVNTKDGEMKFQRKNGHFEDENGKEFSRGIGFESLFWNLFDDKSEYKIPIINNSTLTNVNLNDVA